MIDRRTALQLLAASAMAPQLASCGSTEPRSTAGDGSAALATRIRTFVQMRGALDGRVVVGNVFGSYYGVTGTVLQPLFGVIGATFSIYRRLPDGEVAIVSFEQAYYTTLDGAHVVEEMVNPYTDAVVHVPVYTGAPTTQIVDADLRIRPATPMPGVQVTQSATLLEASPDEVVFVERLAVDLAHAPGRGAYNEIVTMRAPRRLLNVDASTQVGCRTSFTSILAWRDWFGMGERSGHMMAHGAGAYGITATALSRLFVDETRRRRPLALSDPERILAPALRELEGLRAIKGER